LYYYGSPTVERNLDRAYRLLRAAAQQLPATPATNSKLTGARNVLPSTSTAAQAASLLGEMYWRGDGVRQDNATALKWFHRAAENGDANGFANLGLMYLHGIVVPKVSAYYRVQLPVNNYCTHLYRTRKRHGCI
jgi:TPR repeat protein